MLNPYIDQLGNTAEQDLAEDLAIEYIQLVGWNIVYTPREDFHIDNLFGKSDAEYTDGKILEMVVEEIENADGNYELYEVFGQRNNRTAYFHVSEKRFKEVFGKDKDPKLGDILFMHNKLKDPKFDMVFEIKSIDTLNILQFGAYVPLFKLICTPFESKGEFIDGESEVVKNHNNYDDLTKMFNQTEEIDQVFSDLADFDADNPFSKTF